MNTPAHLILGIAAFGKPGRPRVTAAAALGGLAPDLSLYLLAGGALAWGVAPERVFGTLYFSEAWQAVFAVDNSVFVWGAALAVALWRRHAAATAFAAAGLLHLACDLPLHAGDGRPHFWPLTDWVFDSPVSYWDAAHGAAWAAPLETALALGAAAWCWTRLRAPWARGLLLLAVAAQLAVGGVWAWVFA